MKGKIYAHLALTGIRTNRELYVPYLFAGLVMTARYYILLFLSRSSAVQGLKGGDAVTTTLIQAVHLFWTFSLLFLLYADAAILKRRRKEFGLLSVLGMDKRHLLLVLLFETLFTFGIAGGLGAAFGIALSKLAELILAAIMAQRVGYALNLDFIAFFRTLAVFLVIYLLVFFASAIQVRRGSPMELLSSESEGEREPKSRAIPAVFGVVLILAAYALSVTTLQAIKRSMTSLLVSDGASESNSGLTQVLQFILGRIGVFTVLIGIGTVLLFLAGSVFFCKRLKERRSYYYKPAHFVSVSQLLYRMKRNGVSLAVICILSSVLLVVLSTAVGFFSGIYRIVDQNYPNDLSVTAEAPESVVIGEGDFGEKLRSFADETLSSAGVGAYREKSLSFVGLFAAYTGETLDLGIDVAGGVDMERGENRIYETTDGVFCVRVMDWETYARLIGDEASGNTTDGTARLENDESPAENQVLLVSSDALPKLTTVLSPTGVEFEVPEIQGKDLKLTPFRLFGELLTSQGISELVVVVPSLSDFFRDFDRNTWTRNEVRYLYELDWNFANATGEAQTAAYEMLAERLPMFAEEEKLALDSESLRIDRIGAALGFAGGLLFLAVTVAALLLFVTVLIMYYKQISEGYEDRARYSIMRKLGMTEPEVTATIRTQTRTVFFFPLLTAGLHLIFALPLVRLLLMWTVKPKASVINLTAVLSYLAFAIVYLFTYELTTRTYDRIVKK